MAEEPYRNPASAYVDPVRSHREIEVLFRGRPTLVAPSPDLPATGEFLTTEVADIPLLLLRGEDGVVRCYLNARRHRGGRVAGPGRAGRAFVCPYHSWTDDFDGALLGQPQARECFPTTAQGLTNLIALPVDERFGIRSGRCAPIHDRLPDFP
jgi:phenylpropionate dioxygenase-like ring-hydroxylating dioxygenase large terminal subunit